MFEILKYPNQFLRTVTKNVPEPTSEHENQVLDDLVGSMFTTMYGNHGCGLAAPQINVDARIFIIDVAQTDETPNPLVFVNPEIVETSGTTTFNEGCLSFPGIMETIKRAEHVKVHARNSKFESFEIEASGLLSIAIQHELDHLNGVLFIDKLPAKKRMALSRKLK